MNLNQIDSHDSLVVARGRNSPISHRTRRTRPVITTYYSLLLLLLLLLCAFEIFTWIDSHNSQWQRGVETDTVSDYIIIPHITRFAIPETRICMAGFGVFSR